METVRQFLLQNEICFENEFLNKYLELVKNNLHTPVISHKTQRHHIVPKYYYSCKGIEIDNSASNVVNLFYRDHILAHFYLAKCSLGEYRSKNILSIRYLLKGKCFEDFKIEDVCLEDYQAMYEESRREIFEKTHSVEANKKISKSLSGRPSPFKGHHRGRGKVSKINPNAKNKKLSVFASTRFGEKNSFYGRTHSDKSKALISEKNRKPVGMYDLRTGEMLKEFYSVSAAVEFLSEQGITQSTSAASRIGTVCKLNTDYNRAYGYNWRFLEKV